MEPALRLNNMNTANGQSLTIALGSLLEDTDDHLTTALNNALIQEMLAKPLGLRSFEGAIVIADGNYFYIRQHSTQPPTYSYKCLSPSTLALAFNHSSIDSGWLQPGIVRHGRHVKGDWAVLYVPAAVHQLTIKGVELPEPEKQTKQGRQRFNVPLPGLVVLGLNTAYWIFAVKDEPLTPKTRCYRTPLPNVNPQSQHICWGNNQPPTASPSGIQQAWRDFITSPFSGDWSHSKSKLQAHSSDIRKQLLALHQSKAKRYPIETLMPVLAATKTTLENLVDTLLLNLDDHD